MSTGSVRCGGERVDGTGGGPRIANSGSWVYEPLLVHRAQPPHPYWPGGAIRLEDGGDPVAVGLLDDLPASALRMIRCAVAELVPQIPARKRRR